MVLRCTLSEIKSLIGKKLRLRANVRIHRGASVVISATQYDATGKKIGHDYWRGKALRFEMFKLPHNLLGIVGFEFYRITQKLPEQLTDFCNKWLTVESRGIISPKAKKVILSIEIGADSTVDIDDIEIRELLAPIWNVQPARSLFFTDERSILLKTQVQSDVRKLKDTIAIELYPENSPESILSRMEIPTAGSSALRYCGIA